MESKKQTIINSQYLISKETKSPLPMESIHIHSDIVGNLASYKMT